MSAQGRSESRIGAMPMATSHGQPSAALPSAAAETPRMMPHLPRRHAGKCRSGASCSFLLLPGSTDVSGASSVAIRSCPSFPSKGPFFRGRLGHRGAPAISLGKPTEMARAGPQRCRYDEVARRQPPRGFARATAAPCHRRRLKARRSGESRRSRGIRIGRRVQPRRQPGRPCREQMSGPYDGYGHHLRPQQHARNDTGRLTRLHAEMLGRTRHGTFAVRHRALALDDARSHGRHGDNLGKEPQDYGGHDRDGTQATPHAGLDAPRPCRCQSRSSCGGAPAREPILFAPRKLGRRIFGRAMPEYAPSARRSAAGLAASADVVKLAKCGTRRGSGY